jgi:hypothetical protein
MDDKQINELPPAYISVGGFWEHLYAGRVTQLRRDFAGGCRGAVVAGDSLFGGEGRLELTRQELLDYEYAEDLGFSLGVSGNLSQTLAWVIGAPLMEEDTIPNQGQLGLVRRLVRGTLAAWPREPRTSADRILSQVAERKIQPPEAIVELGALAPAFHRNTAPLCRAVVPAVAEGRLGPYEALGLLADSQVPERAGYDTLREILLAALGEAEIPLELAILLLQDLRPTAVEYDRYAATGQTAELHVEREVLLKAFALLTTDPRAVEALHAVIGNEAFEDLFTVKIAIWALGRHNGKIGIAYLVALFDQPEFRLYLTEIEEALSFLCSGAELIPPAEGDPGEHWSEVRDSLPRDPESWWRHDSESVFWEKRLRCALELDRHPDAEEAAARLRMDEVPLVRLAAGE